MVAIWFKIMGFGGGSRSMDMVIAARIYDISSGTMFYSLIMFIQRHIFSTIRDGWAYSNHDWHETRFG